MSSDPRDLLRGYIEVSSLPTVHLRLEEAINNPRKSLSDIAGVIRDDPGLSARLLRIVNSAFYSFPSRVETISQAVSIVGTQQLGALALATSVMHMFKGIPDTVVTMDSFWRHSIACGITARILATYRREAHAERFFVAGILHDLGRLVMFTKITDQALAAVDRARAAGLHLYQAEDEVIGYSHAAVGGVLLRAWKLPTSLEEIVMHHHSPEAATRYPVETALVHVADLIVHTMELGSSGEEHVPPLDAAAWDKLGIAPGILPAVQEQVERQYEDLVKTLLAGQNN